MGSPPFCSILYMECWWGLQTNLFSKSSVKPLKSVTQCVCMHLISPETHSLDNISAKIMQTTFVLCEYAWYNSWYLLNYLKQRHLSLSWKKCDKLGREGLEPSWSSSNNYQLIIGQDKCSVVETCSCLVKMFFVTNPSSILLAWSILLHILLQVFGIFLRKLTSFSIGSEKMCIVIFLHCDICGRSGLLTRTWCYSSSPTPTCTWQSCRRIFRCRLK